MLEPRSRKMLSSVLLLVSLLAAFGEPVQDVETQPLSVNVGRLFEASDILGSPLPAQLRRDVFLAAKESDSARIQELMDAHVSFLVTINPEERVKVASGAARTSLQQGGYTMALVKVVNESGGTQRLRISSPQAGPVYAGVAKLSMERQRQESLRENENTSASNERFLDLEMFQGAPMTPNLSGLKVEYAIALIYSSEAGRRAGVVQFDVGQGNQDRGFRGEVPVLFDVRAAVNVKLAVRDDDGSPTVGRFAFFDAAGRIYPPQAKRLAPDLFFQRHIYRGDGDSVQLPPGKLSVMFGRGPEYLWERREIEIPEAADHRLNFKLRRWVNPAAHGFISGDHHIHASGCAHYTQPSVGVEPRDMFMQVKGEGLNVGCVLTWGPGFDHQQQFFSPAASELSEPMTQLKYDIEVSGFGSASLGHVCLLNLKEQIYPGAKGSQDWPTWTTPVLRWAKAQGGVTGYAHSGSGLEINAQSASKRMLAKFDSDKDGKLSSSECANALLPESFAKTDRNGDLSLDLFELAGSHDRSADILPNLAIPELNGVGAQEIFVTTALGLCDFISAMDTARLREWNCWYHIMNCGFPLKVSGETDFPCMSGTRVGQGRVYVQLGDVDSVNFPKWCEGLAAGRSYVSDGYAHALNFSVNGKLPGEEIEISEAGNVEVRASVAFSAQTPLEAAYGAVTPERGRRLVGDTIHLYADRAALGETAFWKTPRRVELVVNGQVAHTWNVQADDQAHELSCKIRVDHSSWIALRHFPQMHTNPVNVIVGGKPIRASRKSALWSIECIEQLWRTRGKRISKGEREEAKQTFDAAIELYRQIANESPPGS